jgi:hypothetical protein
MEFKLGNSIINSYKRLSYTPWYALAEFVDNSTQAYFNNKKVMNKVFEAEGRTLTVRIDYDSERIRIRDNSYGMDEKTLQNALVVGLPPENDRERSKYGLGMKTAACWFGDEWKITTTRYGDNVLHEVLINVSEISLNNSYEATKLVHETSEIDPEKHYTIIEIRKLNRQLWGKTLGKISDYLRSMYRIDFETYGLQIFWQNQLLVWDDLNKKLYITEDGRPFKQFFEFELTNGKKVSGWVGVLGRGYAGRKHAGFSIIKANRVIEGWPRGFKPDSIFGDLDDGINDLINQRIVGELYLDDFEVSHTKDRIVWLDDEFQEIDEQLGKECDQAMQLARTARFKSDGVDIIGALRNEAIKTIESEVRSGELTNFLLTAQPPEEFIIERMVKRYEKQVRTTKEPDISVEVGVEENSISVLVYFVENSEFDPYVIIESSSDKDVVIVIINALHPHFVEMSSSETITNFIRHCIYDGVAEWKAVKLIGYIQPYTVKNLKDGLLRIPFNIRQNKFR